jgi:hypothetical protein
LTQSTTNLSYTTTSTIQSTSTSIKSQLPDIPTDPSHVDCELSRIISIFYR